MLCLVVLNHILVGCPLHIIFKIRDNFIGVSKEKVQNILNMDKSLYRRNAKFINKATLKPIRARDVQARYQID